MQKLPIGISTFRKLKEYDCLYVDKTEYAYNLITRGWRYFLSRPRRFGKSLFVSTLHEILRGNKALFDNLWIGKSDYQWKEHAVITLDFTTLETNSLEGFHTSLHYSLRKIAEHYSLDALDTRLSAKLFFMELLEALYNKYGAVALLIDEYDNPILRNLSNPEHATCIRDAIRDFAYVIKALDQYINFVFITGVSSFARAGIFSGLNNLQILTLNNEYGAILGYSDAEIDHYFKDYIQVWSDKKNIPYQQLREEVKIWYNGYNFSSNVSAIYNPFSLMNALNQCNFDNFWIQSGTPTFLIKEITKEYRSEQLRIFSPENLQLDQDSLSTIDVGAIPLPTLAFQTGYLTIDGYDEVTKLYSLKIPNFEVKQSFYKLLLSIVAHKDSIEVQSFLQDLRIALQHEDIQAMITILQQLFSRVPYQLHTNQEKFYHAILQIIFDLTGNKVQSEYSTSHGRIDIVLELPAIIYIIEAKLNQSPEIALAQIEEKQYSRPFLKYGKPILLIGLSFERKAGVFDISYVFKKLI